MLSKLSEILSRFGTAFLAYRRTAKDTDVAAAMIRIAVALQDLCVRGERIVTLLGQALDAPEHAAIAREITELLDLQVAAVVALRSRIIESRALLTTVDAGLYVELAPFLDQKSGLIIRWTHYVAQGPSSTTAIFFLPHENLDRVIAVGKAHASLDGLAADRPAHVLAYMDGMRAARSREVRDIHRAIPAERVPVLRQEIAAAKADLERVKAQCDQLLAATRDAVGAEVMAYLRRALVTDSDHEAKARTSPRASSPTHGLSRRARGPEGRR